MILKQKNTRRSPRQWLNTSVQIVAESATIDAMGINISHGGMCLFTVANLPVGSQIEVEFVPPRSRRRIRRLATIRHRAVYLYGLEWLPEAEQPRDAWAEADARRQQQAPIS
jgi:PilZ domain